MKQECENAILEYAPVIRQLNAAINGEHRDYVLAVLAFHRTHYQKLVESGATEWTDLPSEQIQWLNENRPY